MHGFVQPALAKAIKSSGNGRVGSVLICARQAHTSDKTPKVPTTIRKMPSRSFSMSVEALKSLFDVGTVILLFLTFAFGAGVLITGNIINSRQASQLRQFDKDLTEAKTELGKQQERAAKAEQDAADAKKTAEGFRLDIAKSTERAAEANQEAAKANETAEKERLARVRLEEKVAWRTLDKEQKQELASSLSTFAGQLVDCSFLSSDMEAFSFSSEIATALRAANWRVVPPNPYVMTMKETSLPTTASPIEHIDFGIEVVSTSDIKGATAARAVARELDRLGFDAYFKPTTQREQASTVWVTVQHRPLGPQGEAKLRGDKNKRP